MSLWKKRVGQRTVTYLCPLYENCPYIEDCGNDEDYKQIYCPLDDWKIPKGERYECNG